MPDSAGITGGYKATREAPNILGHISRTYNAARLILASCKDLIVYGTAGHN